MLQELAPQPDPIDPTEIAARVKSLATKDLYSGTPLSPDQRTELSGYYDAHAEYLGDIMTDALDVAHQPRSGVVEEPVSAEHPARFTVVDTGYQAGRVAKTLKTEAAPLDIAALGLPTVPMEQGSSVLGVAVRRTKGGKVSGVKAITQDIHGNQADFYLENISAAGNPHTDTTPEWVYPGHSTVSAGISSKAEVKMNRKSGKGIMEVTFEQPGVEGDTISLIRPAMSKQERSITKAKQAEKRPGRGRLIRKIGAVAGLAAVGAGIFPHASTVDNDPVKSGTALFQTYNGNGYGGVSELNGIPQADTETDGLTQNVFTPTTIGRARADFNAYFAGNKAELKQLAAGYEDNWIKPDKLTAVQDATSLEGLQTAMNEAVAGSEVSFTVAGTADKGELADLMPDTDFTPVADTDLANAKVASIATLNVLDTFTLQGLDKQIGELHVTIVNTITDASDIGEADGITYYDPNTNPAIQVAISTTTYNGVEGLLQKETTAGHELTHAESSESGGALSTSIAQLNPDDFQYQNPGPNAGYANGYGEGTSDYTDGNQTVEEPYGNTNQDEDMATVGQTIDVPNPTIDINGSTFQQKQLELLLSYEQSQPGYIANMLAHAQSMGVPGAANEAAAVWNESRKLLELLGIASLLITAAAWKRTGITDRRRQTYAIGSDK